MAAAVKSALGAAGVGIGSFFQSYPMAAHRPPAPLLIPPEETMTSTNTAAKTAARKPPAGTLKAYVASLTGASPEYYDFAIYSVASALVLPKTFFPPNDKFVGLLLSFSAFVVGYLARPIGGIIFGRLGDKIGRKYVAYITEQFPARLCGAA